MVTCPAAQDGDLLLGQVTAEPDELRGVAGYLRGRVAGHPGGGVAEERVEPYWWRADFPPRVGDQTQRGFDPRSDLAGVQVRDGVVSPLDD
jgi:hypothetical protein